MTVYAISDLHLSAVDNKSMDVFGEKWRGHFDKISDDWRLRAKPEDVILIAGDISWAMRLNDARPDIDSICALPGRKVLIKGNHDFWHGSLARTREALTGEAYFLQNDSVSIGDFAFAGSRGWKQKSDSDFSADDAKIYAHELMRLEASLKSAEKGKRLIGLMHFPPFSAQREATEFTRLFSEYGAETVVYGHVHGKALYQSDYSDIEIDGVRYMETSCDYTDFKLREVASVSE